MGHVISQQQKINTEVGTRLWALKGLAMVVWGGIQTILELWTRKEDECCKLSFMSNSSRLGDSSAKSNDDGEDPDH